MDRIEISHILLTGGGAPGFVGIFKALRSDGDLRISSCDMRKDVIGRSLADDFFSLPAGDDPSYIDRLIAECKERGIDAVLPITTRELIPIAQAEQQLKQAGVLPIISPLGSLEIANSKCALFAHLNKAGIPLPAFERIDTWPQLQKAVEARIDQHESFVIKPCIGNGSRGVRIVESGRDEWTDFFTEKPSSLHMDADKLLRLFEGRELPPILLMDYLDGPEYSVDCLVDHGKAICIVPRLRLKINNGISVQGIVERNEQVIDYCEKILASLPMHGPVGIQVKLHGDQVYLLEINPRLQGTSSACLKAGLNLPLLTLDLIKGTQMDRNRIEADIRWGTHFVRHYAEEVLP